MKTSTIKKHDHIDWENFFYNDHSFTQKLKYEFFLLVNHPTFSIVVYLLPNILKESNGKISDPKLRELDSHFSNYVQLLYYIHEEKRINLDSEYKQKRLTEIFNDSNRLYKQIKEYVNFK